MKIFKVSVVVLSLILCGCGGYNATLYKKGGKSKGIVAALPVTFSSEQQETSISWDLTEEMNSEIMRRLGNSSKVLFIKHQVSSRIASLFLSPDCSNIPSEVINYFLPAQFVLSTEIIDHFEKVDPLGNKTLNMSARVRVFDLRKGSVSLIYQEILDYSQPITAAFSYDTAKNDWKSKTFSSTPLGLVHNRLLRELVGRVEGYVCANY